MTVTNVTLLAAINGNKALLEALAKQIAAASNPPAAEQWDMIYHGDSGLLNIPLNAELPDADLAFRPFRAGVNHPNASLQFVQTASGKRGSRHTLTNTVGADMGARAFWTIDDGRWLYWQPYLNRTLRFRAKATYAAPFSLPGGANTFAQDFIEVKTLDTPQTAVQILLKQEADGSISHYGYVGGSYVYPAVIEPLVFGVPMDYECILTLSRDPAVGHVQFTHGRTTFGAYGRTLNLSNDALGIALLFYSNEIAGTVSVTYTDLTIEVKR
jgi:hypothetical protein